MRVGRQRQARRGRSIGLAGGARTLAGMVALLAAAALAANAGAGVSIGPASGQTPTVAYVTDTGSSLPAVWTIPLAGGAPTRLGAGDAPLVSPDGVQVAASLYGASPNEAGPALAIYPSAGGTPRTFLSLPGETALPLAWSRDGRYLAVEVNSTAVNQGAAARLSGLAIVDTQQNTLAVIAHGQVAGASFAPNGSDEIVYGLSPSQLLSGPVNIYRSKVDGSQRVALSRDGRSLNPVWGAGAIAYDKEQLRRNFAPLYQIWLRSLTGSHTRRVTNVRVDPLVSGLVPLAFSADGSRLVSEFVGQDTSEAWTVRIAGGQAKRLKVNGSNVIQAAGLSADGRTILIDEGGFEGPASSGRVATVAFGGGAAKVLVGHGSQASWNG